MSLIMSQINDEIECHFIGTYIPAPFPSTPIYLIHLQLLHRMIEDLIKRKIEY